MNDPTFLPVQTPNVIPMALDASGSTYVTRGPEGEDHLQMRDLLHILRRRWWIVALTMAIFGLAVVLWQKSRVDTYTAEVMLQQDSPPLPQIENVIGGSSKSNVATRTTIILSRPVLLPVIDSLGLRLAMENKDQLRTKYFRSVHVPESMHSGVYEIAQEKNDVVLRKPKGRVYARSVGPILADASGLAIVVKDPKLFATPVPVRFLNDSRALARLRSGMTFQPVAESPLLKIRYTDTDQVTAAAVINLIAQTYQDFSAAQAKEMASRKREFVHTQLAQMVDSTEAASDSILHFLQVTGSTDPVAEGQALNSVLMQRQADLRSAQYSETMIRALAAAIAKPDADIDNSLRAALVLGEDLAPGSGGLYRDWQAEMQERQKLTAPTAGLADFNDKVAVADSGIARTKNELRALSAQWLSSVVAHRQGIEQQISQVESVLTTVPGKTTDLARMKQQVDTRQSIANMLATQYYQAQIAEAVEAGDVRVLEPAVIPSSADPSHHVRNFLLALIVGLLVGGALAFVIDLMDSRARSAEDVETSTGVQVLAVIPTLPHRSKGDIPLPAAVSTTGAAMEAFRMLRTMVRFSRVQRPRVLGVTSPGPGEGKSLIAANYALTCAQDGARVLLIDADLRRPIQHRVFGVERGPGVVNVLVENLAFDSVVLKLDNGVHLLTAGDPTANAAELLGSTAFRDLLRAAAAEYDQIIVDTAPVLVVADAFIMAPSLDAVLLVVRSNRTPREALRAVMSRFEQVSAHVIGAVLNDVSSGSGRYGAYSYSYAYGSNYAKGYYGEESSDTGKSLVARISTLVGRDQ